MEVSAKTFGGSVLNPKLFGIRSSAARGPKPSGLGGKTWTILSATLRRNKLKKFLTASVLALLILGLVAGSAFAWKPPPSGGCVAYADSYAKVDVRIVGPGLVDVDHEGPVLIQVIFKFDVGSAAFASAWSKDGKALAQAIAGAFVGAYASIHGPNGGLVDQAGFHDGAIDFDWDSGKKATAWAHVSESGEITLDLILPPDAFREGRVYRTDAYGFANAFAAAMSEWCARKGGGFCADIDWASAFDWDVLFTRIVNYPHIKLEFRVTAGCVVEVTPYADFATGRLGPRTFEKAAYLQVDPYVPGGKYEPAVFELNQGWYHVDLWCSVDAKSPLGAGVVSTVDLHVLHVHDAYQQIWGEPFNNQAANVIYGLEFVNAQ